MFIGVQEWEHLLFLHYEVDESQLRRVVPPELEIDRFEGRAFVTLIPFRIEGSRPRGAPRVASALIPGSAFEELNFRTYVRGPAGEPGIWFFSLDAASAVAVAGARTVYHLPYFRASMELALENVGWIAYRSRRNSGPQFLEARYRPAGAVRHAAEGTLEHFLVERYVLFAVDDGAVYRARVRHEPYPLQDVEVGHLRENFLTEAGLKGGAPMLEQYASRLEVEISAPEKA